MLILGECQRRSIVSNVESLYSGKANVLLGILIVARLLKQLRMTSFWD